MQAVGWTGNQHITFSNEMKMVFIIHTESWFPSFTCSKKLRLRCAAAEICTRRRRSRCCDPVRRRTRVCVGRRGIPPSSTPALWDTKHFWDSGGELWLTSDGMNKTCTANGKFTEMWEPASPVWTDAMWKYYTSSSIKSSTFLTFFNILILGEVHCKNLICLKFKSTN